MSEANTYKQLKNHLHNTLDITKEDIRTMVEEAVDTIVDRKLDQLFKDRFNDKYQIDNIVDESIKRNITMNNWYWGESEDSLDDYIKQEVVKQLLGNVKMTVTLNKGKSALKQANKVTARSRKRKTSA